jgi:Cu(I)-responsive transcriptional regulator
MMLLMNTSKAARSSPDIHYTIGKAAAASGVSAKMIRHYESIGLIPAAERTPGNSRADTENDVHTLRFIQRARAMGFSMKQIATLVSLWHNRRRSSVTVRRLALDHIAELRAKIDSLQAMVHTLEALASHCHGDTRPECPILDELADGATNQKVRTS